MDSLLILVDDIKLTFEIRDTATSSNSHFLQNGIDKVFDWCNNNRLTFNNQNCRIVALCRRRSFVITKYTMADYLIERKVEIRDFGMPIDKHLHIGHHIERKTIQARRIGFIKHFSNGNFTYYSQKILYLAHVRPILKFASVICSS